MNDERESLRRELVEAEENLLLEHRSSNRRRLVLAVGVTDNV